MFWLKNNQPQQLRKDVLGRMLTNYILKISFIALLLTCFLSINQSCSSKKEKIKQQEIIFQKSKEEKQKVEDKKRIRAIAEEDSIAKNGLIIKYNPVTQIDTLNEVFSFKLREILESHSNLLSIEGEIIDVDRNNTKNSVAIELTSLNGIGKFYCNDIIYKSIIQKVGIERRWNRGFFIVKVTDIIPIYNEISITSSKKSSTEDDSMDYLRISSPLFPYYIFHGELVDFHI